MFDNKKVTVVKPMKLRWKNKKQQAEFMYFLKRLRFPILLLAVLTITVGYGISFPLLAIRLEAMQISSGLIGLNAAMPALGWLFITPFLPKLHHYFSSKTLMLSFLALALLGILGFATTDSFGLWLVFRLVFGGGLGMFFRLVEYWLNTATHSGNRGRIIGVYSVCFLLGIALGSLLQPELGAEGNKVFALIGATIILGAFLLALVPLDTQIPKITSTPFNFLWKVTIAAPLAMAGVVAYGLFEDVPAYLLSIYTLKVGMGEDIAAYTLSAVALGNLLLAIPLGVISDKIGRTPVMLACALVGFFGAAAIPASLGNTTIYLVFLAIWGGFIGGLYSVSLAYIGDHFSDESLIAANAAFGTIYAAAAMLGPLANGMAMQLWEPQGLMVACAIIFGAFLLFALKIGRKGGLNVSTENI
jgi:MFS family permease